jgi:hypothetical protein
LTLDSGQHKNKNGYYHSFKTRLKGQLGKIFDSRIELTINSG